MTRFTTAALLTSALALGAAGGIRPALAQDDGKVLTTQDEIGGIYEGTFRGGLDRKSVV